MTLIGAHTANKRPLDEASRRSADLVQVFLSNPQGWKAPKPRDDAAELRESGLPIYVHAPYLMNLASPNNRIRIPSRKNLAQTVEAAAAIGAAGVIVHGGHVGDDEDLDVGYERWRKALDVVEHDVPILIENTAGGGNAVVRELASYGPLFEQLEGGDRPPFGVCLDTCHAWAAGEDLEDAVDLLTGLVGGVDLVHCNDSRDEAGSGRDRHENLGKGMIPGDLIVGVVRAADAPVVVETPDDDEAQTADIAWLRDQLG